MNHVVETRPLTKFEGGLNLLHEADDDAVIWLESTATAAVVKQQQRTSVVVVAAARRDVVVVVVVVVVERGVVVAIVVVVSSDRYSPEAAALSTAAAATAAVTGQPSAAARAALRVPVEVRVEIAGGRVVAGVPVVSQHRRRRRLGETTLNLPTPHTPTAYFLFYLNIGALTLLVGRQEGHPACKN